MNRDTLNLSRLKTRDSCFTAPSNLGSSTGFRPTHRRPVKKKKCVMLEAAIIDLERIIQFIDGEIDLIEEGEVK